MSITFKITHTGQKGGPGSGFHDHAGRPGKRGGSAVRAVYYTVIDAPSTVQSTAIAKYLSNGKEMVTDSSKLLKSVIRGDAKQFIGEIVKLRIPERDIYGIDHITCKPPDGWKDYNNECYEDIEYGDICNAIQLPDHSIHIHRATPHPVVIHEIGHHVMEYNGFMDIFSKPLKRISNILRGIPNEELPNIGIEEAISWTDYGTNEIAANIYQTLRYGSSGLGDLRAMAYQNLRKLLRNVGAKPLMDAILL